LLYKFKCVKIETLKPLQTSSPVMFKTELQNPMMSVFQILRNEHLT